MVFWIKDGALIERPVKPDGSDYSERVLLDQFHMVKVLSADDGTTIKWFMSSANWSSLIYALTFLRVCMPPFTLTYMNMGWINEQFETPSTVCTPGSSCFTRRIASRVSMASLRSSSWPDDMGKVSMSNQSRMG